MANAETTSAHEDIHLEKKGTAALVTLDRPRALNALTIKMRAALTRWLSAFPRDPEIYAVVLQSTSPKAFCAGSDVREVIALGRSDMQAARKTFSDEYALNWRCECFSKPTISLIDGMVMGGGVGISLYGTHRVAGDGYRFAMPETKIGLFPDVGVCHALARMPDAMGPYLGLTGRTIGRADAYALGLVTHCIAASRFPEIVDGLAATLPVDPLLDERHTDPGAAEHAPLRGIIARCFSAPDVGEILARLMAETGEHAQWAKETATELCTRAPLSLAVTLRHIHECRQRDLCQALEMDYRLACRFLEDRDFYEGVRAVLIEKDAPRWSPASIDLVTREMVARYFAPLGPQEWALPTRADMQAMRA